MKWYETWRERQKIVVRKYDMWKLRLYLDNVHILADFFNFLWVKFQQLSRTHLQLLRLLLLDTIYNAVRNIAWPSSSSIHAWHGEWDAIVLITRYLFLWIMNIIQSYSATNIVGIGGRSYIFGAPTGGEDEEPKPKAPACPSYRPIISPKSCRFEVVRGWTVR